MAAWRHTHVQLLSPAAPGSRPPPAAAGCSSRRLSPSCTRRAASPCPRATGREHRGAAALASQEGPAASVSAASDSQFSVRGGNRVGSRWACTALRVASLFRGPAIWRQPSSRRMAGCPRPRATPGGCNCVFWSTSFSTLRSLVLSAGALERCPEPGWCTLRPANTKLCRSRERNGPSRKLTNRAS